MSDLGAVLRRTTDAAFRVYDGQATIVMPGRAAVHVLNPVGTTIWDLIDGVRTLGQIADALAAQYDVPGDQAQRDVLDFIAELRQKGMVS